MKRIKLVGGTIVLMLASIILLVWLVPSWHRQQLIRQSVPVQQALEKYRQQHGSYPESLSAAKISGPEAVYYQRQSDGSYILWFGLRLGESMTFHSTDQTWGVSD